MTHVPIAVVGVSALFPGSTDATGFWRDILEGRDRITAVPPTHWLIEDYYDPDPTAVDKTYARRGAFLSPVDFDPMEHGLPPTNAKATDTAQLLALIVAKQVLDDATRGAFPDIDRERVSVILGATGAQELITQMASRMQRPVWVKALREHGVPEEEVQAICDRIAGNYVPWQESTFPGLLGNVIAGRIANRFDLGGTNCILDAACASSLSALSMSIDELRLGKSDMVLTGGVETLNDIVMFMCFSKTPAISPTEDCRPFSAKGDGTMLGEGVCFLALRRLEDAERDGNPIYAVIRGIGSSSDGRAKSVYAPVPEGQARALRRAYDDAGYGPDTVELVEAHGTGTKAGDAAEVEGLRMVFDTAGRQDRSFCALGSVKSQIGHTKAAAGAAGMLKAVMALHHKILPPTIKVEAPNPLLRLDESPFYLSLAARPWIRDSAHPRRASVSAFGFGGSNFHVALEEYTPDPHSARRLRTHPTELVVLSADSAEALVALCKTTIADAEATRSLPFVAHASQTSFDVSRRARLAVVATDEADLRAKLEDAAKSIAKAPSSPYATPRGTHYALDAQPGEVAFLFPGQGSQYVGMGADVTMAFDAARAAWDRAADTRIDGEKLDRVVFPHPVFGAAALAAQSAKLTRTEWAQPAIGITSIALASVLDSVGIRPAMVGGHSFGEVTALHAAGAFDAGALLAIARRRGELMAEAADRPGGMIALTVSIEEAHALITRLDLALVVANHNAPTQVVLSGESSAIDAAMTKLVAAGITANRLSVATAFHSPLVAASSAPFRSMLNAVALVSPTIPVFANSEAAPYPSDPDAVRDVLAGQISKPVRFVEEVRAMHARGARTFVEVGPGSVLTRLVGDVLKGEPHRAIALDRKGHNGVTSLFDALGQLAVAGVAVEFAPLWADYAPPVDPRVKKQPAMTLSITGTNYGKPYPPPGGAKDLPKPNPPRAIASVAPLTPVALIAPAALVSSTSPALREREATNGHRAPGPAPAWAAAYQEVQHQTGEVHTAYVRAMAESHAGFLRTAEASLAALGAIFGNGVESSAFAPSPATTNAMPKGASPQLARPHVEPAPLPVPAPYANGRAVSIVAPQPVPTRPAAPSVDLEALLLSIVSDKTGYPAEMLGMEMALEADLGIDSIKRVEILAAMKEQVPDLPAIQASEMAALRTLGQIVAYMRERAPASNGATSHATATPAAHATSSPGVDLEALMLSVVADKTGYPAEMLGMEMALEADLGIDSIKRVEILAAMKEQCPDLPAVQASEMAALRTLGQIVAYMRGGAPASHLANTPAVAANVTASAPAPAPVVTVSRVAPALGRFELREIDALPAGMAVSGVWTLPDVVVVDDGLGVAPALVVRLVQRGVAARVVSKVPSGARGVIFLGGLRDVRTIDEALAINADAFEAARIVAPSVAASSGLFVTVQDTGGDFGLSGREPLRAWSAGLSGLAKTAAQEWPGATVRAIDLERGGRSSDDLADALAQELLAGGPELEIGLHADGRRTTLESHAVHAASGELVVDGRSVVVASGGARGVTAATLIELARVAKPKLVLLGRTELRDEPAASRGARDEHAVNRALLEAAKGRGEALAPTSLRSAVREVMACREIRATLDALRAAGSEALYVPVDVKDAPALRAALDDVRGRFGAITGIVHGAGVLADKLLTEKTTEQFRAVFDTKVLGLRALLEATEGDPLRFLFVFSSVAGRTGNAGQSDYAMANEVLNKVAGAEARRRGGACVVKSLDWGPWESGMVTPALRTRFAELGVPLIPLEAGAQMLLAELTAGGERAVEIVLGGEPRPQALLAAASRAETVADILVNAETYPFIESHRIQGVAVVPLVLVLEWFTRAASALQPGRVVRSLHSVKVLRGIRLAHHDDGGERFRVACKLIDGGASPVYALELRGEDGTLHYTATATLEDRARFLAHEPPPAPRPSSPTSAPPWSPKDLYPDLLFHGPDLQVIFALDEVTEKRSEALLAGVCDLGWSGGPWQTDVAALDGGLQLARLWGIHTVGRPSLPTRLGSFVRYRDIAVSGPLRCVLTGRSHSDLRTVSDLVFVDDSGRVAAEMRDVEMHVLPATAPVGKTSAAATTAGAD